MADDQGFEPYHDHHHHHHVPQQSRRDKLRFNINNNTLLHLNHNNNLQGFAALFPLYNDPSLISPDFITCAAPANVHRQGFGPSTSFSVKEEGMNLMGFGNSSSITDHMYVDPSAQLNPSSITGNPYAYTSPYRGVLEQSFHGNEAVVYKPEPINSGQSLSLSLSSHQAHNNIPLELNMQRYDSSMFSNNGGAGSSSVEICKSRVPLGPFTGYASVLKGSRFLKPAQQLLEELCDVGNGVYVDKDGPDPYLSDPAQLEGLSANGVVDDSLDSSDGGEQTRKKSRLLSMLDEVYKRYKQYYQQMHAAVASFESVSGLSGAAPFASLAVKAMSKHFRCLKNAITDQLQFTSRSHGKIHCDRDETQRVVENSNRAPYNNQRPFHSTGFVDQPVWRPQRGLPERAVTVLRAWLFEHFLHPYPTDTDKLMLAKQTGLSRNQVSNWFINARVRLWKPMVEEIHMLETRQGQKGNSQREDNQQHPNRLNDHLPTSCSTELIDSPSTSIQRIGDFALKRTRDHVPQDTPSGIEGSLKFPYDQNLLHNNNPQYSGIGVSNNGGGGVSLTLGLHQNGVGLPESSYPINAARRFGLDGEGYIVSGFGGQNRQLGRDIMDGQLLHEFVG